MSFTEIDTVKIIHDHQQVYTISTHAFHIYYLIQTTFGIRDAQNAVQIWEFLGKWYMGSCNFPAGVNELTFTHSTRKKYF